MPGRNLKRIMPVWEFIPVSKRVLSTLILMRGIARQWINSFVFLKLLSLAVLFFSVMEGFLPGVILALLAYKIASPVLIQQ